MRGAVLLIHKRSGMASFDVIRQLRRILRPHFGKVKMGFAGTLDPFAEGLLPVFLGSATNLISYLEGASKTYRVVAAFGQQTTTGDVAGEPVREMSLQDIPTLAFKESLDSGLQALRSLKQQRIPAYSAAKYKGKKLYEYARAGQDIPVLYKDIEIYAFQLLVLTMAKEEALRYGLTMAELEQYPLWPRAEMWSEWQTIGLRGGELDEPKVYATPSAVALLEAKVSAGTFIRQLVEDLGDTLGMPAYAMRLLRSEVGSMHLSSAIDIASVEDVLNAEVPASDQVPWPESFWPLRLKGPGMAHPLSALPDMPVIECSHETALKLLQGQRVLSSRNLREETYALRSPLGFLGFVQVVGSGRDQCLRVGRMLIPLEDYRAELSKSPR